MLTIFHISDLHFGAPYVPHVGEAVIRAAHELHSDLIVASGDFTQRAKPSEYEAARAFLDRLPPRPLIVTPGNHDVPLYRVFERILAPHKHYKTYISDELNSVTRLENAVIVALNSSAPHKAITNGRIEPWQLEYAKQAFDGVAPGIAKIVVAHHHFAPAPDYEGGEVMPHAKRAMDFFEKIGVEMVLGGHLHRAYIGNSLDVYPGTDREHGIIIVQSGTSTSRRGRAREREKNSFNMIRVTEDRVRITHYMYFDELLGFAPVARHLFPRAGKRFLAWQQGEGPEEGIALAPPVGVPRPGELVPGLRVAERQLP